MNDNDTHQEQINTLKETGMQNISWDEVNSLNIMKDQRKTFVQTVDKQRQFY